MLGWGAKDEAIAFPPGREEAFLVVGGHGEPKGFGLKVVHYFRKLALERFNFMGERLLEVQEGPRGLARTG